MAESGVNDAAGPASSTARGPHSSKPRSRLSRVLDWLSWVVLIGFGLYLLFRDSGGPVTGQSAPPEFVTDVDSGARVALPPHGQPILVKVFASWCGACRRAVWLEHAAHLDAIAGLPFVAVSVDESIDQAKQAREDWSISGPVYFDESGQFSRDYAIEVLPTYVLIDQNGKVVRVTSGLPGPLDYRAFRQAGRDAARSLQEEPQ